MSLHTILTSTKFILKNYTTELQAKTNETHEDLIVSNFVLGCIHSYPEAHAACGPWERHLRAFRDKHSQLMKLRFKATGYRLWTSFRAKVSSWPNPTTPSQWVNGQREGRWLEMLNPPEAGSPPLEGIPQWLSKCPKWGASRSTLHLTFQPLSPLTACGVALFFLATVFLSSLSLPRLSGCSGSFDFLLAWPTSSYSSTMP